MSKIKVTAKRLDMYETKALFVEYKITVQDGNRQFYFIATKRKNEYEVDLNCNTFHTLKGVKDYAIKFYISNVKGK